MLAIFQNVFVLVAGTFLVKITSGVVIGFSVYAAILASWLAQIATLITFARDFIMEMPQGYDTLLTERGANPSQDQRQIITIARALVADPKRLILDEATSNVDTRTEKLIQDGMRKLMEG
jgi:ABC-type transport system involved in Fe-S cluster assembly fused permease/ATPase subunit